VEEEYMRYRKKPVVIEAVQFTGDNLKECTRFCHLLTLFNKKYVIPTLEGNMEVSIGDYIIKGVQGEFYPCKPDIFLETYDEV
jgi:hypothetical protein